MKLIFQIAAGLVIGLLAYQILGFMMMDARNENMDDSLTRAAQLKTGANRIMNMVHEFHGEHRRLPNSLAELACRASDPCDYRKDGGRFYASYGNDWIVVEPIIVLDEADFNCWSTLLPLYDPHFQKCTRLEADDVPEFD